jgi:hypothetical protein
MAIFLENPTEFIVRCDKNVHYSNGTFSLLPSGTTGPSDPKLRAETPNALRATIFCKKSDKELFLSLKKSVENLQSDDVKIHTTEPRLVKKIISIKPGHEEKIKEIEKRNEQTDDKYKNLCDQLYELGCERVEGSPDHIEIPLDYYNTVDEYHYDTPITIFCTNTSELYEQLTNR